MQGGMTIKRYGISDHSSSGVSLLRSRNNLKFSQRRGMAMPLFINSTNYEMLFFSFYQLWLCNVFFHLSRDTSVFNTESRGFKLNAFKLRSNQETLWLPDNTDGLPQHYIVNFFRHLPKCNLQQIV